MDDNAITVILPTHNRRLMLAQCLDMLLSASEAVSPANVVVIDDDSHDGSEREARKRGTGYVRVDLGEPGLVRNAGLSRVKTEFVMFLDDDDVVQLGHPDRMLAALRARPEAGFAYGQAQATEQDLTPFGPLFPAARDIERDHHANALLHRAQLGTVVFRTEAVQDAGGFDTSLRFFEDCDLQVRIAMKQPAVFVPGRALLYRVHADSVTGRRSAGRFLEDLRRASSRWSAAGVPRDVLRRHANDQRGRASFAACYAAERLARNSQRREASVALLDGLRLSPMHALMGHRYIWKAAWATLVS